MTLLLLCASDDDRSPIITNVATVKATKRPRASTSSSGAAGQVKPRGR